MRSPPPVNTLAWLGLAWLGLAWLGLAWLGLAWLGLAWPGLAWLGLAWPGLTWPGLAWPGLAWPGLVWPGPAWPGLKDSTSTLTYREDSSTSKHQDSDQPPTARPRCLVDRAHHHSSRRTASPFQEE